MKLRALLQERKNAIVGRWLDEVLAAYPADGGAFFRGQPDRFANPVGHSVREGTRGIFDALVEGAEPEAARGPLEAMLRVRAVQQLPASLAVGFVLGLKGAIRAELGEARRERALAAELERLEARIDRLALEAFDLFVAFREELGHLRIREMERRTSWIVGQLNRRRTPSDGIEADG